MGNMQYRSGFSSVSGSDMAAGSAAFASSALGDASAAGLAATASFLLSRALAVSAAAAATSLVTSPSGARVAGRAMVQGRGLGGDSEGGAWVEERSWMWVWLNGDGDVHFKACVAGVAEVLNALKLATQLAWTRRV